MKRMYRQGDLLFIETTTVQGSYRSGLDILKSSVTGHSHRLSQGKIYVNESTSFSNPGNFYLKLDGPAQVTHEEHGPIPLTPGVWEVRRQKEVGGYVQD